jgi:hypothetical protein
VSARMSHEQRNPCVLKSESLSDGCRLVARSLAVVADNNNVTSHSLGWLLYGVRLRKPCAEVTKRRKSGSLHV